MSNGNKFSSKQYIGTPRYELKQLLIALREVNGISLQEMSKKVRIPAPTLQDYERDTKPVERFESAYIAVLREYVSLSIRENMGFEDALRIYINQRSLHRFNISYKVALFGSIMYDSLFANMNAFRENAEATDIPTMTEELSEYHVWSEERYNTAFYLLGMLREMLGIDVKSVASNIGFSKDSLRLLESCEKSYKNISNVQDAIKCYCDYLSIELVNRGIHRNLYEVIYNLVEAGCVRAMDSLKLRQKLLDELFKE